MLHILCEPVVSTLVYQSAWKNGPCHSRKRKAHEHQEMCFLFRVLVARWVRVRRASLLEETSPGPSPHVCGFLGKSVRSMQRLSPWHVLTRQGLNRAAFPACGVRAWLFMLLPTWPLPLLGVSLGAPSITWNGLMQVLRLAALSTSVVASSGTHGSGHLQVLLWMTEPAGGLRLSRGTHWACTLSRCPSWQLCV